MSKSDSAISFQKEFFKSVEISMRSDVPIGCQLSGGLDSSSILAAMDHFNSSSKKINTFVKDLKLKIQSQIQGEQLRVTGKKIDDLQFVIDKLKNANLDIHLDFVNFKK